MENKFKLKKPLPQSWGVLNDGSKEFKEWVLGYLVFNGYNYIAVPKDNGYVFGFSNEDKYTFPAANKMFDAVLTIEEFKSHFETEPSNEWREERKHSPTTNNYLTNTLELMNNKRVWKDYFPTTKKTHLVTLKPCPSCGTHYTPQPVSDKIAKKYSFSQFECDGCEAYREHLV